MEEDFSFQKAFSSYDFIKSAPMGIIITDSRGIIITANKEAESLLKIKAGEVVGKALSALECHKELDMQLGGRNRGILHMAAGLKLLISKSPFHVHNKTKGTIYAFQDIPAPAIQETLHYCNLEALIEGSYDGIILTDHERIIKVNSSFLRISGLRKEYAEGKLISELSDSPHICLKSIYEVFHRACRDKKSVTVMRTMHQGNEIYVTGAPIKCNGEAVHVAVNIRDVTELQYLKEKVSRLTALYLSTPKESQIDKIIGEEIVIESPAIKRVLELTLRIAQVDSVVLINGESGTGKEIFAKLVHSLSARNNRPFISINCGAIPENLLESELFGYEKGSFTGAGKEGKPGLFELADGGIIFLDEIGEMPLSLQVKLLKVLQDMKAYRLGGVKPVTFDVRIIAATNRNLLGLVKEGRFREDLFYRIYVVPIEIPPLRERREDIFPLSWHFLKKYNQKYKQAKTISSELIEVLESYSWPGNVRELQNVIERLVVTSDSDVLKPEHLPRSIHQKNETEKLFLKTRTEPGDVSLFHAREQVEKTLLARAISMKQTTREIAHLLGIDHSTVVRKLQKYGLSGAKKHHKKPI